MSTGDHQGTSPADPCAYHWRYVKREGAVVCEKCSTPVAADPEWIDIGADHWIRAIVHKCQEDPYGTPLTLVGYLIMHIKADGEPCDGMVTTCKRCSPEKAWDLTVADNGAVTFAPSVLCRLCGDHGFVRDGRWVL